MCFKWMFSASLFPPWRARERKRQRGGGEGAKHVEHHLSDQTGSRTGPARHVQHRLCIGSTCSSRFCLRGFAVTENNRRRLFIPSGPQGAGTRGASDQARLVFWEHQCIIIWCRSVRQRNSAERQQPTGRNSNSPAPTPTEKHQPDWTSVEWSWGGVTVLRTQKLRSLCCEPRAVSYETVSARA